MSQTTVIVPISMPKALATYSKKMASTQGMTTSEYFRSLARRDQAIQELRSFQKVVSAKAKKAGIKTFKDIMRISNEVRYGTANPRIKKQ